MPRGVYSNKLRIIPSRKGAKITDIHKKAISRANKGNRVNENSPHWKGEKVKYSALHSWVRKSLGNPKHCSYCQAINSKKFEWANKSHSYKRILSDWVRLCTKCHIAYDKGKIKL